eukprot:350468-Chlamydomonas_euryale.AAC.7
MDKLSLAFSTLTNECDGLKDAKSEGGVVRMHTAAQGGMEAAATCQAARPTCAPIGTGPIGVNGRTVWPGGSPGVG